MIFDFKREIFEKSSAKGALAEKEIADYLNEFFSAKKMKDTATLIGDVVGNLPRNKTGDIVCFVGGDEDKSIVIECKFDKNVRLGDIANKDVFTRKSDTAWSQLIESQANRGSDAAIIVFDISSVDKSILDFCENVAFIPSIGFIVIVNSQENKYANLSIAYMLASDIILSSRTLDLDKDILSAIITRIVNDAAEVLKIKAQVQQNIDINFNILKQLEKGLLLIEFSREYLKKFLRDGTISKADLLDFYMGESIKDKFSILENEINSIADDR
jgi:hypothetical protein